MLDLDPRPGFLEDGRSGSVNIELDPWSEFVTFVSMTSYAANNLNQRCNYASLKN